MSVAVIRAIEYYLPPRVVSTRDLADEFPEWPVEKIEEKTGISQRHVVAADECSSDLAVKAASKLFDSGVCLPADIDFLLLCTQSPDYFLPTTACLVQDRLGIPTAAGALDFNLGCSGFVYGLGLAHGLIATGQASNILLVTAETYSKFMHSGDKSVRTIFGDGAAATLIQATDDHEKPLIGPFVFGTDGSGSEHLIVPTGGMRRSRTPESSIATVDESGSLRAPDNLYMNGAEIFNFTLRVVPNCVQTLLHRAGLVMDDVDFFVFHQANRFMLDHLRRRMKIPESKFPIVLQNCGNTVSSTIPIALRTLQEDRKLSADKLVVVVGFGVGYSWAAGLIRWAASAERLFATSRGNVLGLPNFNE